MKRLLSISLILIMLFGTVVQVGSASGIGQYEYVYDRSNRLISILFHDGVKRRAQLQYDHNGNLLYKAMLNDSDLAGGIAHTLVLRNDQTVWAWGKNDSGQLGDGTTISRNKPLPIVGLSSIVAIEAGSNHSLALKSDGTVWAFGSNTYGQLGDGTTLDRTTPAQVPGLASIVAIAAGADFSLALKSDGSLWAFGRNDRGQLGDSTTTTRKSPVRVQIESVIAVSAGSGHVLAITRKGELWSWGLNADGQLGNGTNTDKHVPAALAALSSIQWISAGDAHSLALKSDGTAWAFGDNTYGQLGDGTTTDRLTPVKASTADVIDIAAGANHSMALLRNGQVQSWGYNGAGQLGNGTTTNRSVPSNIVGLDSITNVENAGNHSLFAGTDGTVWVTGANGFGQLGNGTLQDSSIAVPVFEQFNMPPTVPTQFNVVSKTDSSVQLAWSPSEDNSAVAGYEIYSDGVLAGSTEGTSPTIELGGLVPNTIYHLTVKARDIVGNLSEASDALPVLTYLSAPTQLIATNITDSTASLVWTASVNSGIISGYDIFEDSTLIGNTAGDTTYELMELAPNTTYSYTVRAKNAEGNVSMDSEALAVTTEETIDVPDPDNLLANPGFEQVHAGIIDNWNTEVDSEASGRIVSVTSPVNAGYKAIEITASGLSQWRNAHATQRVEVIGGGRYRLSGYLYTESLNHAYAELNVQFHDAEDQYIVSKKVQVDQATNGYMMVEQLQDIPLNAKYAYVTVYLVSNQDDGAGTIYADDIRFEYTNRAALLTNGNMESSLGGTVVGWDKYVPLTGNITSVTSPVDEGSKAVLISANDLQQWDRVYLSQRVEIAEETNYRLSGRIHAENLSRAYPEISIRFTDENDQLIANYWETLSSDTEGYVTLEQNKAIPVGAKYAYVMISLVANEADGSGTIYVDDVKLEYANELVLLTNGGFENTSGDDAIGWQTGNDGSGSIAVVGSPVSSGSKAMKIEASGLQVWQNAHIRQGVEVEGGQAYTVTGQVYAAQLTDAYVQVAVLFHDANWVFLGERLTDIYQTTDGYLTVEQKGMIPQGAVRAETQVRIIGQQHNSGGIIYVDDIRLEYGTDGNLVSNAGFEYSSGTVVSGWRTAVDSSGIGQVTVVDSPAQSGERALKIEASGIPAWHNAQATQEFAVESGRQYRLSGDVYIEELQDAMAEMQITFWDANNQYITQQIVNYQQTTTGYIHLEKFGTIPQEAVKAELHVWLAATADGGGGIFYADNIEARYASYTNLLDNGDFENASGNEAIGWQTGNDGSGSIAVVDTPVSSGSKAVKIEALSLQAWQNAHIGQGVEVEGGQSYTVTGQVYAAQLTDAFVQVVVLFHDEDWIFLGQQTTDMHQTTSGYVTVEQKGAIPQGAVRAEPQVRIIGLQQNSSGIVYVDNMRFEYGADGNLVSNAGFEYSSGTDMSGWQTAVDSSGIGQVTVVDSPVQSGERALKIEASGMLAWHNTQATQEFTVEGGRQYRLSGDVYVEELQGAMAEMQITFWDANNQYITQHVVNYQQTTTGYIHLEKFGTIPQEAVKAELHVWLAATADGGGGIFYADNIEARYASYTNLLDNGGFENTSGDDAIGWQTGNDGSGSIAVVGSPVSSGSKAMKIEASGLQVWQNAHIRQGVEVEGGQAYTVTGQVYAAELTDAYVQVAVLFHDANWVFLGEQLTDIYQTTDGYIAVEQKGIIPQGAVRAETQVRIIGQQYNSGGIIYVDDMRFEYGTDGNLVSNAGFEYSSGTVVSGWRTAVDSSGIGQVTVVDSPAQSGERALKIEATGMLAWHNAQATQEFAVEGGRQYRLSGDVYVGQIQDGMAEMQVTFRDANNQYLADHKINHSQTTTGYIHLEKFGTIPQQAAKAELHVWLVATADNGGGVIYADNIEMRYTENSNLLVNADFEYVSGNDVIGWGRAMDPGISGEITTVSQAVYTPYSGNQALMINVHDMQAWQVAGLTQYIEVAPDQSFMFEGYTHAEQLTNAFVQFIVRFYDDQWNFLGETKIERSQLSSGFEWLGQSGTIPNGATIAQVNVNLVANQSDGGGTVFIDALQFRYMP